MEDTTQIHEQPASVRRLTRSRDDRFLGGVCAGLGRYFDVNPAIYRIVFAALAVAGGAGLLLYVAAWLVIPDEDAESSIAETALRDHRDRPILAIGVGLLGFALLVVLSHAAFWPHPGNLWLAAVLVGGALVWWELRERQPAAAPTPAVTATGDDAAPSAVPAPAPPAPRKPSLFLPVVGSLLAGAGIIGLLEALDVRTVDLRIALAVALLAVGAAIAAGAVTGRRVSGLVGVGLLLLVALATALAIRVPLRGGIGDRLERPQAVAVVDARHYRLAIGQLRLDLRDLDVPAGTTRVRATVGIGHLLVTVPENVEVDVHGKARAGDVVVFGSHESGTNVERHVRDGSSPRRLDLDLDVGLGDLEVVRG